MRYPILHPLKTTENKSLLMFSEAKMGSLARNELNEDVMVCDLLH